MLNLFSIGDLITLSNNEKYIFLSSVFYEGKQYVYVVNEKNITDFLICRLENDELFEIDDEDIFTNLCKEFYDKLKDVKYE